MTTTGDNEPGSIRPEPDDCVEREPAGPEQASAEARSGDDARAAVDELYRVAYDELKSVAAAIRRGDPYAVISTKTLVHEAWIRLAASPEFRFESRAHLRNIVIRKMRQILVDSARRRRAGKRAGIMVTADESIPLPADPVDRILAIDDVLRHLEELDALKARIVEARFFAELSFAEIAADLGISESGVRRHWKAARSQLLARLQEPVATDADQSAIDVAIVSAFFRKAGHASFNDDEVAACTADFGQALESRLGSLSLPAGATLRISAAGVLRGSLILEFVVTVAGVASAAPILAVQLGRLLDASGQSLARFAATLSQSGLWFQGFAARLLPTGAQQPEDVRRPGCFGRSEFLDGRTRRCRPCGFRADCESIVRESGRD